MKEKYCPLNVLPKLGQLQPKLQLYFDSNLHNFLH